MLWKKLLAPALLTLALTTAAVSSVSAAGAPPASDAVEALATLPGQEAPTPQHARITDPAVACQHQDLHIALPPLCKLWASGTLTPEEKEAIGHIIVRVANISIHRPILKERLIERCERFLAAHPDADGPRVTLCKRIIAGETITPEELRSLREDASAAPGERKARPAAQGTPGARIRPAVTATPTS